MARMRLGCSSALIVSSVALVVSGCGGSGGNEAAGEKKEPRAVLAEAAHAFGKVKSYHFSAVQVDGLDTTSYSGDVFASGDGRLTLGSGPEAPRAVFLRGVIYVKAAFAFWRAEMDEDVPDRIVRRFANRWIREEPKDGAGTRALLDDYGPKRLSACFGDTPRELSRRGANETVQGQEAAVLQETPKAPGSAPSLYYVTAAEPARLLRIVQTGRAVKGRLPRACGGDKVDTDVIRAEMTLSRFDQVPEVTAPKGAVGLEDLFRGGAGGAAPAPRTAA